MIGSIVSMTPSHGQRDGSSTNRGVERYPLGGELHEWRVRLWVSELPSFLSGLSRSKNPM